MKKKIIIMSLIIVIFLIESYLFFNYIYLKYRNKNTLEKTDIKIANELLNSPFKLDKIILYSSASAENKNTNFQSSNWILDIFQYTDIAIYINSKETIKKLSISNPNLNNNFQKLYYLDSNEFGSGKINKDFEINDNLDFSVLNLDNSDNSVRYNTPVFFSDSSNPITLKFTNTIFKDYSIKNTEKLIFNGTLLAKTPIKLKSLSSNISFNINIKNYNNEIYETQLNISIPIQNESSNIFDGSIYLEKNLNIPFLIKAKK